MARRPYLHNLVGAGALALGDEIERAMAADLGLPAADMAALVTLHWYEGLNVNNLAGAIGLSQSATVRAIDRLTAADLAQRGRGRDGRTLALTLTGIGHERAERALEARGRTIDRALHGLSGSQLDAALMLFETILANFTEDRAGADHLCRLCDATACPAQRCPVETKLA